MVQSHLIEFLVYIVFYFSDMRLTGGGGFVFCKLYDEQSFGSNGMPPSFGILTKVISIGRLMLPNNKFL